MLPLQLAGTARREESSVQEFIILECFVLKQMVTNLCYKYYNSATLIPVSPVSVICFNNQMNK